MRIKYIKRITIVEIILLFIFQSVIGQDVSEIKLYKNKSGFISERSKEIKQYDKSNRLTHISGDVVPRLLIYKPTKANGTSIIVCPGGGYSKMNVENTRYIAERFNRLGITAFVLLYRLPINDTTSIKSIAALQDVQQAFRIVRGNALQWGLSPYKIGLWGSSAGGHLAAMAATHSSIAFLSGAGTSGLRPDFLILAWPVISFREGLVHKGSMKNLLGKNPSEEQIAFYCPDEWVDENTPPTFLVNAEDDKSVPVGNSICFFKALKKSNVPAELHIYENGGHGFGIAPEIKDSWFSQLENWLRNRNLI